MNRVYLCSRIAAFGVAFFVVISGLVSCPAPPDDDGRVIGSAKCMNERGQVVGWQGGYAFVWDVESGMRKLGALPGDWESSASDINDNGQVLGNSGPQGYPYAHGFVWDETNGMTQVGPLMDVPGEIVYIEVSDINGQGQVIGWVVWEGFDNNGSFVWGESSFVWDAHTGVQDLGTLGGESTKAVAISDDGHVVGGSTTEDGVNHAFLWQSETGMRDLGTISGEAATTNYAAAAINVNHQVIGLCDDADAGRSMFYWDLTNGMLPVAPVEEEIGERNINNQGQVVFNSGYRAHIWSRDAGLRALGDFYAVAINEAGQVAGTVSVDDQLHAVRWDPHDGLQVLGDVGYFDGLYGRTYGTAIDINNRGQVLVSILRNSGLMNPYGFALWD